MKKEDYSRIDSKLDRQTNMLIDIQRDISKEVNLIKLAHQRLKYAVISLGIVTLITLSIVEPKLVKFFKTVL